VLGRSAGRRRLVVRLLELDGTAVAGLLVHVYNDRVYLSLSGVDPARWDLNASTYLQYETALGAIKEGRRAMHFAAGVDTAKLRWTEDLETHHEFAVAAPGRRSRALFATYWAGRALAQVRREARRTHIPRVPHGAREDRQ
jgi:hypothetical protein